MKSFFTSLVDTFASLGDGWMASSNAITSFDHHPHDPFESTINPATGLPMAGGVDIAGNPYGCDLSSMHGIGSTDWTSTGGLSGHDSWSSTDSFGCHSSWGGGGSMFD